MNDGAIFAIGAVLFIFLSWATTAFLMKQFSLAYQADQAADTTPSATQ